jgi:hypothetical protein
MLSKFIERGFLSSVGDILTDDGNCFGFFLTDFRIVAKSSSTLSPIQGRIGEHEKTQISWFRPKIALLV